MENNPLVIEVKNLKRRYGKLEALNGLNLKVSRGRCFGFFGRNGAGKTTAIKCLLNLLRPDSGEISLCGFNPQKQEVEVKSRLCYVPDAVAFYPWMTVAETLRYLASFRKHWNLDLERHLLGKFGLDSSQNASHLSKGQKTQVALISAVCPEPDLLILDEPTSGLDSIVRREFIETVIGAYQSADPENRTVFVSTHLITEFEGLIDEFTIIDQGRNLMTMGADEARGKFRKIRARFAGPVPNFALPGAVKVQRNGRELELLDGGGSEDLAEIVGAQHPEDLHCEGLTLEEIFVAAKILAGGKEVAA